MINKAEIEFICENLSPEEAEYWIFTGKCLVDRARPSHLLDNPTQITVSNLQAKCAKNGFHVFQDSLVTRKATAFLLGRKESTIANWSASKKIKTFSMPNNRALHSLDEIARIKSNR